MIIWIDGTLGVGKTTVALNIKERNSDNEIEYLDSDFYFREMLKEMMEYAEKNHCMPAMRGLFPQTNKDFFVYFRKIIEEKSETSNILLVSMALIEKQCKEEIFDYLINKNRCILHIILTANKETIKKRIECDNKERDKKNALEILDESVSFLDRNFVDALRIDTDNKNVCDIADEIIKIIKTQK